MGVHVRRDARGKPTLDEVLLGEPELARSMADALAAVGDIERWTHPFHTYPAGLHPDAAGALLSLFEARRVLDPFCGGGTVLVEARAAGLSAIGRDVSSTALRVAATRCRTPSDEELTAFRSASRRLAKRAMEYRDLPPPRILSAVEKWYAPHALCELEGLRTGIQECDPAVQDQLWATLSSILIKVSWRKSDTSGRRVVHRRPPGTTATLFHKRARELARQQVALREAVPDGTPQADVRFGDVRMLSLDRPVDLVLTSPPYPATYDYVPLQHLRRVWIGTDAGESAPDEIGARRHWRDGGRAARARWRKDTHVWMERAARVMAPGAHLVIVIGDGLTPGGVVDTSDATEAAAREAGLRGVARASLERPDHARGTSRWEHVFCFRKPG